MGIKVRQGEYCEFDNEHWPSGLTPKVMYATFSGIHTNPRMSVHAFSGTRTLKQITATLWRFESTPWRVDYIIDSVHSEIAVYNLPYWTHFHGYSTTAPNYGFPNLITNPINDYFGGSCEIYFNAGADDPSSGMGDVDAVGLPLTPKLFAETIISPAGTVCNRYANKRDATKLYIRKDV